MKLCHLHMQYKGEKMTLLQNLHIHTKYSDGEFDEYQIIEEVLKSGVTEFAICDHDTFEGSKRVYDLLQQNNFSSSP